MGDLFDQDFVDRFAALPAVMQRAVFCLIYEAADASREEKRAAIGFLDHMGKSVDLPEKTRRLCDMAAAVVITVQAAAETGSAASISSSTDPTF